MQKCGNSLLNILGGGCRSSSALATRCRCWWAVTYGLDQLVDCSLQVAVYVGLCVESGGCTACGVLMNGVRCCRRNL